MGAPRKERVGSILKFERANHATQPVLQSPSLSPPVIPFSNYPEEKNRRKKKQQINRNQSRKTDANHGLAVAPGCVCGPSDVISPLNCRDSPGQKQIGFTRVDGIFGETATRNVRVGLFVKGWVA